MPVLASRVMTVSLTVTFTTSLPSFVPPFRTRLTCPPPDDDLNETDGIGETARAGEQTRPSTITARSRRIIDVSSADGLRAEWPATSSRHGRGSQSPASYIVAPPTTMSTSAIYPPTEERDLRRHRPRGRGQQPCAGTERERRRARSRRAGRVVPSSHHVPAAAPALELGVVLGLRQPGLNSPLRSRSG